MDIANEHDDDNEIEISAEKLNEEQKKAEVTGMAAVTEVHELEVMRSELCDSVDVTESHEMEILQTEECDLNSGFVCDTNLNVSEQVDSLNIKESSSRQLCEYEGGSNETEQHGNIGQPAFVESFPLIEESFELQEDNAAGDTEMERILKSVNSGEGEVAYEMPRLNELMNEYKTKMLMESCFPTLFPNGCGGFHAMDDTEKRVHKFDLAEYCAHLMTWHDRRFVIHRNFKFSV